jgi:superfamily II DNA or RNA helicase
LILSGFRLLGSVYLNAAAASQKPLKIKARSQLSLADKPLSGLTRRRAKLSCVSNSQPTTTFLMSLRISPSGRLALSTEGLSGDWSREAAAFTEGSAPGFLSLAAKRGDWSLWPAELAFWKQFVNDFLAAFAHRLLGETLSLPEDRAIDYLLGMPGVMGGEYVTVAHFHGWWSELEAHATLAAGTDPKAWLGKINPAYQQLGRVTLHLAENKRSADKPFAFMATYVNRLSAKENPVHVPLSKALVEFAGAGDKATLKSLLEPVQKAAEQSEWMRDQLESQKVFQPQLWTPPQAFRFLQSVAKFEDAGLAVRIPNWWRTRSSGGVKVSVGIGATAPSSGVGLGAMLDFDVGLTLNGEELSAAEWKEIMSAGSGLVALRGQWVAVDRAKLEEALNHWSKVRRAVGKDGISLLEGMRMLAGTKLRGGVADDTDSTAAWSHVNAGAWLRETLEQLRQPSAAPHDMLQGHLKAKLRPYQEKGVAWLASMGELRLGACLADDMGLGKTIQVISLLLRDKLTEKKSGQKSASPSLLVAPASLLGNWRQEIQKFAPDLVFHTLHPSETPVAEFKTHAVAEKHVKGRDLILTTYSMVLRNSWMAEQAWRYVILDEAQAIKNAGAKQTQAVKKLPAHSRIALTGTPVENNLGDLWSLYDFLNPGLLGKPKEFNDYLKSLQTNREADYRPLRKLIQPYLLRRMKTDKSIIADLPDKTEVSTWCLLAPRQAALYEAQVRELKRLLEDPEITSIQRKGLVLTSLMKFKQICNHPSQWLKDGTFQATDSGKFTRLAALCEEIAERQEKVLIFTQFQEMTTPLAAFLRGIFGRPGLVLHGDVAVKERQKLVTQFQTEDGPPFFVLSLKAGGTGLTLTHASHVVHFDRWWNPAVENQATDRAFRIGQKRNVMVHKFVCRGTIEERISALLEQKTEIANAVIDEKGGAGKLLMDMSNEELLRFVSLDIASVGDST